ncbi:MAG TPA: serine/threonine-protein kinase [Vicinamibacterales bacterium]|nr:serine/threonine-protein kinase [Vicinamibacterales bacterium]
MDADAWRQAKDVLAEALLCPAQEREAFIAARCADPALRHELQTFLNQYDDNFLESVLSVSDAFGTSSSDEDARQLPDIQGGHQIGPYVVIDRLGIGGMGHVFLGNDMRLQRKVALKCLVASASATELRSRILHEARAAARVTHPNIAIVHDVVEHENRPFLVMEYVEGESLAALLKRERPSVDRILTMLRQLASALAAAHGKGIVHRDLKPANIQVTPDGSVKILDFGVAHAISAGSTNTTPSGPALTLRLPTSSVSERRVMHPGTPAYMSPEQMFGREIDQRSDIYSLGVIVYEMATGRRPYSTENPVDVVVTLSKNFLRPGEAQGVLDTQMGDIVAKMLAVKPDDRFQTAGQLENALLALTGAAPAPAAAPVRSTSASPVAARIVVAVAVLSAGVVVLGFIETQVFNTTLGRVAPFDRESAAVWLEMGIRGLVAPLFYTLALFVIFAAVKFVVRVLSLSRGIEHLLTTGVTRTTRLSARLGLEDPSVLSQAVAGIGLVVLAVVIRHFWPFISAFATASISTQPASRFLPLQPVGLYRLDAQLYRVVLTALVVGFALSLARVRRLRAARAVSDGAVPAAVVGLMLVTAILLCQAPYRILWKNESPRLDVAGERCYQIGESGESLLIHCPDRQPPRNRIVTKDNPSVHPTGIIQNIFTPPDTPSSTKGLP